jgi:hypothetical protein
LQRRLASSVGDDGKPRSWLPDGPDRGRQEEREAPLRPRHQPFHENFAELEF